MSAILCRAVLAAVAVTCTFPPIAIANTQGTELVQLKDLLCVLWFSGLKKEDMDVALLSKLRRHNINMGDMNNETMPRECAVSKLALTTQSEKPTEVTTTFSTTVVYFNYTNAETKHEFNPILKFITDYHEMANRKFKEENHIETHKITNAQDIVTNFFSQNMNGKPYTPIEKSSTTETTQVNVDAKIHDILSFWQTMARKNTSKNILTGGHQERIDKETISFTTPLYKTQITLLNPATTPPVNSGSAPTKRDIDRWIAEIIQDNMKRLSTTTTTTTQRSATNDLGELLLPFYKDLIKSYNSRQSIEDMVNSQVKTEMIDKYTSKSEESQAFDRNNVPYTVYKSIDDILKANERLYNPFELNIFPKILNTEPKMVNVRERENKMDPSCDNANRRRSIRKNFNGHQKIPTKTIQEVADTVKQIVLKDLSHIINVTTPTSTQVSTVTPTSLTIPTTRATTSQIKLDTVKPAAIKPQNWTGNVNQVMEKILDLYERVKAISEKVDTSKNAMITRPNRNQGSSGTLFPVIPTQSLSQNTLNTMPNIKQVVMNPYRDLTRQEIENLPSIIQTNSGEVAPLVIPMASPVKIVNQIVVVTTQKPTVKKDHDKSDSKFKTFMENLHKNRGQASLERKISQKHNIPNLSELEKYYQLAHYDINPSHKEVTKNHDIADNNDDQTQNFKSRHNQHTKEHLGFYHNVKNRQHINYFDFISNSNLKKLPAYRHSEKFHEKLERENGRWRVNKDGFSSGREGESHRNVAPRHQQPLNSRHNEYDDIHFRNFLKTQQKVNDMLERILGTKNSPPSIETA